MKYWDAYFATEATEVPELLEVFEHDPLVGPALRAAIGNNSEFPTGAAGWLVFRDNTECPRGAIRLPASVLAEVDPFGPGPLAVSPLEAFKGWLLSADRGEEWQKVRSVYEGWLDSLEGSVVVFEPDEPV